MSVHDLGSAGQLPLSTGGRWAIGISWDTGKAAVDVDLQGIVVDENGIIIDAVYYNNMKALGFMTHSGDELTGAASGIDEMIWMNLSKVPVKVKLIIFVVAVHKGGHLRDVANGIVHVLKDKKTNEVARFAMERSSGDVDVVAALNRSTDGWALQVVDLPAQTGAHFMDILEPTVGDLVRTYIPGAPSRQKVAFAMDKGDVVDLPNTNDLRQITTGLGWDVDGDGVDLDVSAVLLGAGGKLVDTVFFGNLEGDGVTHSGDNLTGEGEGDDEQIVCEMDAISKAVEQIFIVANVYTQGVSFQQVSNAYCRVFDSNDNELARYYLKEAGQHPGLIVARLIREHPGNRWSFQAIGRFAKGTMAKDCYKTMLDIFGKQPRELQMRQNSVSSFDTHESNFSGQVRHVDVTSGDAKPCCAVQ
eukprot:TRINITY_DN43755_c0_g1_i1.p1 TRINITY_DN43755_c0_g1~~TRINITY_DN43755_c0_g1_i1.p1  ORF type:complete len:416 (+),score=64.58 TRINITY_DN43755_c0_g1_i1:78-1325(+)